MRPVSDKIIEQQMDLVRWMRTKRKATVINVFSLRTLWYPIFKYYMRRFGDSGDWHDWSIDFKDVYYWKQVECEIHYCSDRMNFGRLIRICVMIERLER